MVIIIILLYSQYRSTGNRSHQFRNHHSLPETLAVCSSYTDPSSDHRDGCGSRTLSCDHLSRSRVCDQAGAIPSTTQYYHEPHRWRQPPCRFYELKSWAFILNRCYEKQALLILPNVPEQNRTVRATRTEQSLVYGMPWDGTRLLLMAPEHLHLFAQVTQIEQLKQMISASRYKPIAIVVPLQVHHGRLMGMSVMEYAI